LPWLSARGGGSLLAPPVDPDYRRRRLLDRSAALEGRRPGSANGRPAGGRLCLHRGVACHRRHDGLAASGEFYALRVLSSVPGRFVAGVALSLSRDRPAMRGNFTSPLFVLSSERSNRAIGRFVGISSQYEVRGG